MKRLLALLMAMAMLAGACGGDDDDAGGDTDATKESTTTTEDDAGDEGDEDEPADEEDLAIAEAAMLTEADFPAGWTAGPRDENDDEGPNADDCPLLAPY